MVAAQAAQVRAVGRSAVGVGLHVVEVGARGGSPAAGMAAGAVAGVQEPALRRGRGVPVDRGWPVQHRAAAGAARVVGTAAADQALELRSADRRLQGAGGRVDQRDVQRPAGRRLQPAWAQRVQLLEQVAQLLVGDRRPVDRRGVLIGRHPPRLRLRLRCLGRAPTQHRQRRDDLQMSGHRLPAGVPRPQDQVGGDGGAQLPDRPLVAVLLGHPRVGVDPLPAGRRDRGGQLHDELRHPVPDRPHPHISRPLGLLPPPIGSRIVQRDQRGRGPLPQPHRGLTRARPLQGLRLDLGHDRGLD